jgi:hypothetical protein
VKTCSSCWRQAGVRAKNSAWRRCRAMRASRGTASIEKLIGTHRIKKPATA